MDQPRTNDLPEGSTAPPASPPPPRGPGKRELLLPAVIGAVALVVGVLWGVPIKAHAVDLWHVVFGEGESAAGDGRFYTCGMHPWVILPKPGDCPICHMKLEPIDPDKFTGEVSIDPVVVQNIGVRVSPVESQPLTMTIRTVGAVTYDETRVRDINTKVSGWIERLHVDWLGAPVEEGQPLVDMYSPELYAAQGELLSALTGGGGSLAEAARTRLRYLDVTAAQIAELEAAGQASKAVTLRSPFKGLVVEKHANEGMAFEPGMQLYRIADLSKVWVMVTLYEMQLPFVKIGARATMTLPYGGIEREGRVTYVYPTVNTRTREVQVRLEFDNPDLALKPGMFASVTVENTLKGDRVVVPRAAVIDTGMRKIAFVSLGEGKFEPRDVETGVETDRGVLEITKGLKPGEQVVTSGQFLLDSEAKMREALARMMKGDLASEQKPAALVAGASELTALPPDAAKALGDMLDAYFAIADALAADSADTIAGAGRRLGAAAAALAETSIPDKPHFWHQHTQIGDVRRLAGELGKGPGIVDARGHVAELSVALGALLRATGVPPSYGKQVEELHCPMYQDGSTWLQAGGGARNPYYGAKMLTCSDARVALPVSGTQGTQP